MNRKKDLALMAAGILLGTALAGPTALAAVSYTHLDVYKRQTGCVIPP